jgi:hypothetical protein
MPHTTNGGRGGPVQNRFPNVKGTEQVDPKTGPAKPPTQPTTPKK